MSTLKRLRRRYGVRVPALIVSPRVQQRSVSKTLFDHTSIIKTILLRFCAADLKHRSGRPAVPPGELTSEEAHKFRRLDQPAAATFTTVGGPAFEPVTTRSHLALLLGPFQQAGPSEQGDPQAGPARP